MPETGDLSFDVATALQETGDPRLFAATVNPRWAVGDKPNGGYLLATLGRAARSSAQRAGGPAWDVVSSSVTYLPRTLSRTGHREDHAAPERADSGPRPDRPGPRSG